jgi:hypothetical protein
MRPPSSPRRWCAWCVAVPVLLIGSQAAHALAYRLAYPSLHVRMHVLAATGHGYLSQLPLAFGAAGAVALSTLCWTAVDAARGGLPRPIPPAAFAVLPPLAFSLQELTERWLAVGGIPWWMVEQPTFRIGLLLQLPFGLLAYVVTRVLLRGAHDIGRRAAAPAPPRRRSALPPRTVTPAGAVLVSGLLPAPWSTRGPPAVRR